MTQDGGSFAQLRKEGQWNLSTCRLYLDIDRKDAQAMRSIWIEASEDEGPDGN